MSGHIKQDIDILTVTNGPTYLVYVVNTSYYHWDFIEVTVIVADASLLFHMWCCRERSCFPKIFIWCHCKTLDTSWVVNVFQTYYIAVFSNNVCMGLSFISCTSYYVSPPPPPLTVELFRCCNWLLEHFKFLIRVCKSMLWLY